METGKKTCEKLKDLRKQVAEANGIEYEPAECTYEGDCPGTCPRCDAELADLQRQLDEKEARGEEIVYGDGTMSVSVLTEEVPKDLKEDEYSYPETGYTLMGDITTVDMENTMGYIISKDELPEGEDEAAKGELLSDIDYLTDNYKHFYKKDKGEKDKDGKDTLELV